MSGLLLKFLGIVPADWVDRTKFPSQDSPELREAVKQREKVLDFLFKEGDEGGGVDDGGMPGGGGEGAGGRGGPASSSSAEPLPKVYANMHKFLQTTIQKCLAENGKCDRVSSLFLQTVLGLKRKRSYHVLLEEQPEILQINVGEESSTEVSSGTGGRKSTVVDFLDKHLSTWTPSLGGEEPAVPPGKDLRCSQSGAQIFNPERARARKAARSPLEIWAHYAKGPLPPDDQGRLLGTTGSSLPLLRQKFFSEGGLTKNQKPKSVPPPKKSTPNMILDEAFFHELPPIFGQDDVDAFRRASERRIVARRKFLALLSGEEDNSDKGKEDSEEEGALLLEDGAMAEGSSMALAEKNSRGSWRGSAERGRGHSASSGSGTAAFQDPEEKPSPQLSVLEHSLLEAYLALDRSLSAKNKTIESVHPVLLPRRRTVAPLPAGGKNYSKGLWVAAPHSPALAGLLVNTFLLPTFAAITGPSGFVAISVASANRLVDRLRDHQIASIGVGARDQKSDALDESAPRTLPPTIAEQAQTDVDPPAATQTNIFGIFSSGPPGQLFPSLNNGQRESQKTTLFPQTPTPFGFAPHDKAVLDAVAVQQSSKIEFDKLVSSWSDANKRQYKGRKTKSFRTLRFERDGAPSNDLLSDPSTRGLLPTLAGILPAPPVEVRAGGAAAGGTVANHDFDAWWREEMTVGRSVVTEDESARH